MDIKTRLNRCCGKPIGGYNCCEGMRCTDCFDKLEGLREIEELNERVETLRQVVRDQTAHGVEQMKEIERFREALQLCVEAIGEWEKDPNSKDQYLPRIMFRALRLAQSALQQKEGE